jgi:hypothetical protein
MQSSTSCSIDALSCECSVGCRGGGRASLPNCKSDWIRGGTRATGAIFRLDFIVTRAILPSMTEHGTGVGNPRLSAQRLLGGYRSARGVASTRGTDPLRWQARASAATRSRLRARAK